MAGDGRPAVMLFVRFKSELPVDELERRYKQRLPDFQALPGLLQKYYLHDKKSGEWAGLYLWDSQAALEKYLESDLRKSIPGVYEIVGAPKVEAADVIDVLRPERP